MQLTKIESKIENLDGKETYFPNASVNHGIFKQTAFINTTDQILYFRDVYGNVETIPPTSYDTYTQKGRGLTIYSKSVDHACGSKPKTQTNRIFHISEDQLKTSVYDSILSIVVGPVAEKDIHYHPKELRGYMDINAKAIAALIDSGSTFAITINDPNDNELNPKSYYVCLFNQITCKVTATTFKDDKATFRIVLKGSEEDDVSDILSEIDLDKVSEGTPWVINNRSYVVIVANTELGARNASEKILSDPDNNIPKAVRDHHMMELEELKAIHSNELDELQTTVKLVKRDNDRLERELTLLRADRAREVELGKLERDREMLDYRSLEQKHKTYRAEVSLAEEVSKALPGIIKTVGVALIAIVGWKIFAPAKALLGLFSWFA